MLINLVLSNIFKLSDKFVFNKTYFLIKLIIILLLLKNIYYNLIMFSQRNYEREALKGGSFNNITPFYTLKLPSVTQLGNLLILL
jgi:hypothetical protein